MKKILAILLTVCMVIWTIPATVFADTTSTTSGTGEGGQTTPTTTVDFNKDVNISLKSGTYFEDTALTNGEIADLKDKVNVTYGESRTEVPADVYGITQSVNSDKTSVEVIVTKKSTVTTVNGVTYEGTGCSETFDIKYSLPADANAWKIGYTGGKLGTENVLFPDKTYTGKAIVQNVLVFDKDNNTVPTDYYKVEYSNNQDVGLAGIKVVSKGKYKEALIGTGIFNIKPATITSDMISLPKVKLNDKAGTFANAVKVTCGGVEFKNYTINVYKGATEYTTEKVFDAGTYKVVVTCNKEKYINLTGTAEKSFTVDKAFKYSDTTTVKLKTVDYNGGVQTGNITVKGGSDYTISYEKNGKAVSYPVDAGTYDVILADRDDGKARYENMLVINQLNLTKTTSATNYGYISGLDSYYSYANKPVEPTFTVYWNKSSVALKKGTDYTVAYKNNTYVGTGTIVVNFMGNFTGSISQDFKIQRGNELSNYTVYIPNIADQAYTGTYVKPYVSVYYGGPTAVTARTLLTEGVHYTLSYTSNINAGTATVTVTGKGAYSGTVTKNFNIKYNLSNATVTTTPATYAYDGRIKQPAVTVKIGYVTVPASDYIVTYSNNLKVGTATATVTAKTYGKSMGSNMAYFTITGKDGVITPEYAEYSKKTTKSKPFAIKIVSNTTDGIGYSYVSSDTSVATVSALGTVTVKGCGRTVITITTTGNRAYNPATATVTVTVKPTKGIVTSLKSTGKGKMVVRYKKESPNADYYQIRYGRAGNYDIRTVKNSSAPTGKSTIKGLQSDKKYFIKVRGVKELADGTVLYGSWSKVKNAVTK